MQIQCNIKLLVKLSKSPHLKHHQLVTFCFLKAKLCQTFLFFIFSLISISIYFPVTVLQQTLFKITQGKLEAFPPFAYIVFLKASLDINCLTAEQYTIEIREISFPESQNKFNIPLSKPHSLVGSGQRGTEVRRC